MPGGYSVRLESNKLKSNKIKDSNMIRNIVGALLFVGSNRRNIIDIEEMLNNYDKPVSLYTASACGLYLVDIKYKNI